MGHFPKFYLIFFFTGSHVCTYFLGLMGKWADPGDTAMPGRPVTKPEQAPELHPLSKISLISKEALGPRIRY